MSEEQVRGGKCDHGQFVTFVTVRRGKLNCDCAHFFESEEEILGCGHSMSQGGGLMQCPDRHVGKVGTNVK